MAKIVKQTDRKKPWALRQLAPKKPYPLMGEDKVLESFLIICEGSNTEPEYFKSFPLSNASVESYGLGSSKTALVKQVISILASDEVSKSNEVWVVFDFDIKPDQIEQQKQDYNNAVELAQQNGLHIACSNDAFELWFLLHYQFLYTQWTRHQYYEKLSELWDCNYEKAGKALGFCRRIYQRLQDDENADQEEAIKRAKRLHEDQQGLAFAERNPHTSVYQLVKELNEYL